MRWLRCVWAPISLLTLLGCGALEGDVGGEVGGEGGQYPSLSGGAGGLEASSEPAEGLSVTALDVSPKSPNFVCQGTGSLGADVVTGAPHGMGGLASVQVAKAVNMSPYYFCKVFKKATGLTFVEYLSRVRIEKVKNLLLNPHTRVSEAAFEAGFQSLSQFNRVFRRVAGEAPSDYRERLHGEGSRPALVHAA